MGLQVSMVGRAAWCEGEGAEGAGLSRRMAAVGLLGEDWLGVVLALSVSPSSSLSLWLK